MSRRGRVGAAILLLAAVTTASQAGCASGPLVIDAHDGAVTSVAFTPDGSQIVTGGEDGRVRIFSTRDGSGLHALRGHTGIVSEVAVSPRGNVLASSGDDGTVRLWTVQGGHALRTVPVGTGDIPAAVTFSPDGDYILVGNAAGAVSLYLVGSGRRTRTLPRAIDDAGGGIVQVAYAADGEQIAVVDLASIEVRSADDGRQRHRIDTGVVHAVAFSPTGEIVAGLDDGSVRLYRVSDGRPTATLEGHEGAVRAVAVTSDGALAASAGDDGVIRLWALAFWVTGSDRLQQELEPGTPILTIAFGPRGDRIATGGIDGKVRIYEVPPREPAR